MPQYVTRHSTGNGGYFHFHLMINIGIYIFLYNNYIRQKFKWYLRLKIYSTRSRRGRCQMNNRVPLLGLKQRTLTRSISEVRHLNYCGRQSHLKLYTLERRRDRCTIVHVWNMIFATVPNIEITSPKIHSRSCEMRKMSRE